MFGKKQGGAISPPVQPTAPASLASSVPDPEKKSSDIPVETHKKTTTEDDIFKIEEENVTNISETSIDSSESLRLQRARNRIWLDLRDGIDLKALARMKAEEARSEVNSAVEEIARFRNLDLTPAEL